MHTRLFTAKNDSGRENVSRRILLVALFALFLFPLSAFAQCNTSWTGGATGNWNVPGDWSSGVPTSSTNSCISTAGSTVTLNIAGAATDNLTLGLSTDTLSFNNGTSLTVSGSTISDAGTITLNSAGSDTALIIGAANVTLSGSGTITMSNSTANLIYGAAGTDMLINQSTIQGAGNIGFDQMALNNSGTIDSNQSAGLTLEISNGATNTGTIEATAGSTLTIALGTYANAGGTILNNASTIVFEDGVTINGGTITQTGAGTIKLSDATINTALANTSTSTIEVIGGANVIAGTLTNPAGGQVKIDNGGSVTMGAGSSISNGGTIALNSAGSDTALIIGAANVTLSGSGTITMSNSTANLIYGAAGTDMLTNQSTIQGAGNIGFDQMALNNSGTIDSNQTAGLTLEISNGATNTGTIEATAGSTLTIALGTYANAGGTILNNASTIVFEDGVTINGGTITQTGAGTIKLSDATINTALANTSTSTIEVIGGANVIAGTLTNPAGGQVKIDNGGSVTMGAGSSISNGGTIALNSAGSDTALIIGAANVTLSGSGTITMSNSTANLIYGAAGTDMLINQSTIQGAGNIGFDQMALNNSGTIDSNQTAGLTLEISNGATNTGTIEATAGSTLTIALGTYANAGGTILNNASTIVFEDGVTINGGTITQTGAGTIKLSDATINTALANTSTSTIEVIGGANVIAGTLTNPAGGQVKIDNGGSVTMGAGSSISNGGTIALNSAGSDTALIIGAANVTLSGSGTITMSNSTANLIYGAAGTDMLTNQSTIQGAGNIGFDQMALNNSGTIDSNQTAGLTLEISNGATNTGTIEATAGSTLTVVIGTYTQTGSGKLLATGTNSEVLLDDTTIIGGTLTGASGGKFVAENSSTLNGVTISTGTIVNLGNGQVLNLAAGTITNKGTINVGSTGSTTELNIDGSVTLASTGKIILSASPDNFILGSGTLTNQNTIEGEGNIGVGEIALVNSGSILANEKTTSTLFIDTNGTGFTNNVGTKNGILNVSAKNTVIIEGGPLNNLSSGTLTGGEYLVTGTLEFAAGSTGIVTNDAIIDLTSATAAILNTSESNASALSGLASNGTKGSFTINALTFTTSGNFTNNGTLGVGAGAKFAVGTNGADDLTNYSGATSTLTGGTYIFTGTGQLQFNNQGNISDIVTNDASITLAGADTTKKSIIDQTGQNALANFNANGSSGSLTLTTDRNFTTGGGFTNAGTVTVSKSTGTGHTLLTINGTYQNTGTTTVDGMLTATSINVTGGFIYGNLGTITGTFDLTGGTLNPGDGLKKEGTLNIAGNYTETGSGILNIDLDGTTAGTKYDVLNISGTAALGGTLDFDLISTFKPTVGETFDVINYSSETGSFTTVNLPTAPVGDHWVFACGATDCTLTLDSGAAGPASAATSTHNNVASPVRHATAVHSAAIMGDDMRAPSATLTRAETCGGFRTFASFACMREAVSGIASGFTHTAASHGTMAGTLHNNVASVSRVHSNVAMAQGIASSSHEPTVSATSVARFYICAYMSDELARTMGCR